MAGRDRDGLDRYCERPLCANRAIHAGKRSLWGDVKKAGARQRQFALRQAHTTRVRLDVKRVLEGIGGEGRLIDLGFGGDEDLRELGAHGGRDDDKGGDVFPTGELRRYMAIVSDEGVASGDGGASLAEEGHGREGSVISGTSG